MVAFSSLAVCPIGTFGNNCSGICACLAVEQCDVQTGKCMQCNLESDNGGCNFHKGISIH